MHITHVLYAPAGGNARAEAVRLLQTADIKFAVVEWSRTGSLRFSQEISLVTSLGEFGSLEGVRLYVRQHRELATVAQRIAQQP